MRLLASIRSTQGSVDARLRAALAAASGETPLSGSFRRHPLTEADRALWASYVGRVAPLKRRSMTGPARPAANPESPPASGQVAGAAAPPVADLPPRPRLPPRAPRTAPPGLLGVGDAPGGLDGATWQRLRSGKFPPERRLDLHGHTAQHAYHALVAFLRAAHADRLRCVEVITGRGSGGETGVLRRELPFWLNLPEIRPLVLAAVHPHAANTGAVRVLLRRVR